MSNDAAGGCIDYFAWNPVIPNVFAYMDEHGCLLTYRIDQDSTQLRNLGKSNLNDDNSSS